MLTLGSTALTNRLYNVKVGKSKGWKRKISTVIQLVSLLGLMKNGGDNHQNEEANQRYTIMEGKWISNKHSSTY